MRFVPTPLEGAFVIELDKREDERGVRWNDPRFGIKWPEIGRASCRERVST